MRELQEDGVWLGTLELVEEAEEYLLEPVKCEDGRLQWKLQVHSSGEVAEANLDQRLTCISRVVHHNEALYGRSAGEWVGSHDKLPLHSNK